MSLREDRVSPFTKYTSFALLVDEYSVTVFKAETNLICISNVADWMNVEGFNRNVSAAEAETILPMVLRYLTPNASIYKVAVGCLFK
jgi:hypothetical protein